MGSQSPATTPARLTPSSTVPVPVREDCWTEEATHTLVEAWGERYIELNRGNLRQKHWEEVADVVNDRHGHVRMQRRTDIQCKNRIDTLKKKYKIEKGRVSDTNGVYTTQWPFFPRLDALIGDNFPAVKKPLQAVTRSHRKTQPPAWTLSSPVPVGPRSGTQKRPAPSNSLALVPMTSPAMPPVDDSYFRRNFTAFAAAAAAAAEEEEKEDMEGSWSGLRLNGGSRRKDEGDREVGYRELAHAIQRFGEIYERVEGAKQKKMFELEKQRMQFAKDLEYQRMQVFMETQIELQKLKRAKKSSAAGNKYS